MFSPTPKAIPFLLHALTELIASTTFLLSPTSHIPTPSPQAILVSHLLGGSLLHSALLALLFASRADHDSNNATTCLASLAFALWHVFPCYRAVVRIRTGMDSGEKGRGATLGGPVVHLGVHGGLLLAFLWNAAQYA